MEATFPTRNPTSIFSGLLAFPCSESRQFVRFTQRPPTQFVDSAKVWTYIQSDVQISCCAIPYAKAGYLMVPEGSPAMLTMGDLYLMFAYGREILPALYDSLKRFSLAIIAAAAFFGPQFSRISQADILCVTGSEVKICAHNSSTLQETLGSITPGQMVSILRQQGWMEQTRFQSLPALRLQDGDIIALSGSTQTTRPSSAHSLEQLRQNRLAKAKQVTVESPEVELFYINASGSVRTQKLPGASTLQKLLESTDWLTSSQMQRLTLLTWEGRLIRQSLSDAPRTLLIIKDPNQQTELSTPASQPTQGQLIDFRKFRSRSATPLPATKQPQQPSAATPQFPQPTTVPAVPAIPQNAEPAMAPFLAPPSEHLSSLKRVDQQLTPANLTEESSNLPKLQETSHQFPTENQQNGPLLSLPPQDAAPQLTMPLEQIIPQEPQEEKTAIKSNALPAMMTQPSEQTASEQAASEEQVFSELKKQVPMLSSQSIEEVAKTIPSELPKPVPNFPPQFEDAPTDTLALAPWPEATLPEKQDELQADTQQWSMLGLFTLISIVVAVGSVVMTSLWQHLDEKTGIPTTQAKATTQPQSVEQSLEASVKPSVAASPIMEPNTEASEQPAEPASTKQFPQLEALADGDMPVIQEQPVLSDGTRFFGRPDLGILYRIDPPHENVPAPSFLKRHSKARKQKVQAVVTATAESTTSQPTTETIEDLVAQFDAQQQTPVSHLKTSNTQESPLPSGLFAQARTLSQRETGEAQ